MALPENLRLAIFVEDLYNELEFWYPRFRMLEEGAKVLVIGPERKEYRSKLGYPVMADLRADEVEPRDFHGLIIPGGYAPDKMRRCEAMVEFVRALDSQGALIAQICHAGWVPISAGILRGKRCTSYAAIRDDMINAGGIWEDSPVVVDTNLVSSRCPEDLPAFCRAIIEVLSSR
ncbi:MAG TPA: type 1 glutamine amidotransferase domain-containing protein [Synergistaceae bacterium]|nr:type 1 glutamine amidotransferase domain-containing protein [Synergistaceae bacterium]HPQ37920.1 type 1 glutamine amidotransferase domain-containing protein [Synergistaceae bacterium]